MQNYKNTKIICTIGPSSWDPDILKQMVANGMNIARINGAFADIEELKRVADLVRSVSNDVALMLDIKGHEIRLNKFAEAIPVKVGQKVIIGSTKQDPTYPVTYPNLYKDIKKGQHIFIDKGEVELEVIKIDSGKIHCKVLNGTEIEGGKGMNLPGSKLNNPPLTAWDIEQINFAVKDNWEFVAASFIRNANDIKEVHKHTKNSLIKVIAKIEDQQGVENFSEILEISDGIMIARGDMGSELPLENLPMLQKEMIYLSNLAAKPVITATNMLESMRSKVFPTRAEITDVANAVLDGTDALMTSGETTTGKYPIQTVEVMARIARENEKYLEMETLDATGLEQHDVALAMSNAAMELIEALEVDKIILLTHTGTTARIVSRYNPGVPVVAVTTNDTAKRQLAMTKGVIGVTFAQKFTTRNNFIIALIKFCVEQKLLQKTDKIVLFGKAFNIKADFTNVFEYIKVADVLKLKSSQKPD